MSTTNAENDFEIVRRDIEDGEILINDDDDNEQENNINNDYVNRRTFSPCVTRRERSRSRDNRDNQFNRSPSPRMQPKFGDILAKETKIASVGRINQFIDFWLPQVKTQTMREAKYGLNSLVFKFELPPRKIEKFFINQRLELFDDNVAFLRWCTVTVIGVGADKVRVSFDNWGQEFDETLDKNSPRLCICNKHIRTTPVKPFFKPFLDTIGDNLGIKYEILDENLRNVKFYW